MSVTFLFLASVTLAGAIGAMAMRNLVHCAVCLVATFVGLAGLYLQLNAQFVGLVQLLVYVGAVAILIVFAILLTRSGELSGAVGSKAWPLGLAVAVLVGGSLTHLFLSSPSLAGEAPQEMSVSVKQIGNKLMTDYVLPLEVIGLLLTAALIGAVIIAMRDGKANGGGPNSV